MIVNSGPKIHLSFSFLKFRPDMELSFSYFYR
ncbi:hypothetical protein SSU98_2163 [Streptococcus suis 98HAH33]|nr:hypothetical protein SSU05_2165 [Streptococcus suis 05ZYH33]ABP93321.1 hypothetical protein SSU98_2163 [Streptococcus suis 98HAH33]